MDKAGKLGFIRHSWSVGLLSFWQLFHCWIKKDHPIKTHESAVLPAPDILPLEAQKKYLCACGLFPGAWALSPLSGFPDPWACRLGLEAWALTRRLEGLRPSAWELVGLRDLAGYRVEIFAGTLSEFCIELLWHLCSSMRGSYRIGCPAQAPGTGDQLGPSSRRCSSGPRRCRASYHFLHCLILLINFLVCYQY